MRACDFGYIYRSFRGVALELEAFNEMYNFENKTVREIAIESPLTVRVFSNHKIDFCCGGRVPFDVACERAGADAALVMKELEQALESAPERSAADEKTAAELITHIVETHHEFTRSEIARLRPLADKVFSRHGDTQPELWEIRSIFNELADELLAHMRKEEMMLFPYIEQIERAADAHRMPPMAPFGTVGNPVRMMMFEHDQAGEMLGRLRALSSDYTAPDWACPSYKGLYAGLEFLEADLHQHIHLENNILFPQAVEMEKRIFEGAAVAV
jgi:regulator of cell morphogenesis and NO signaling